MKTPKQKLVLFSLLILGGNGFNQAQAQGSARPTFDECSLRAQTHASPEGSRAPATCAEVVANDPLSLFNSAEGRQAAAQANMLSVANADGEWELIAGDNSKLREILDLKISPQENRVYVLNKNGESRQVLSFPADAGGNLAPRRKLVAEEIDTASSITLNWEAKKLFVASTQMGWIKVFHLHADPDGRRPANSTESLATYDSPSMAPLALAASALELAVLETNRVLVFNVNGELKQSLALENGEGNAKKVVLDSKENALLIRDQEGADIVFQKDENGLYHRLN